MTRSYVPYGSCSMANMERARRSRAESGKAKHKRGLYGEMHLNALRCIVRGHNLRTQSAFRVVFVFAMVFPPFFGLCTWLCLGVHTASWVVSELERSVVFHPARLWHGKKERKEVSRTAYRTNVLTMPNVKP